VCAMVVLTRGMKRSWRWKARSQKREEADIGGSDVIINVFRNRTELRLQDEEKNFEFNAGGEGKPMKCLCHKRGNERETGKTSNETSGCIDDSLDKR